MANLINIINTAANHMAKLATTGQPDENGRMKQPKEYTSSAPSPEIGAGESDGLPLNGDVSLNDIAGEAAALEDKGAYGLDESKPSLGYKAKGELNRLKYKGSKAMDKLKAYALDNPNLLYGAAGAAGAGGVAYLLAKLLKKKRAWAYALGGAAAGGAAGALGGQRAISAIKEYLANKKQRRLLGNAEKIVNTLSGTSSGSVVAKENNLTDARIANMGEKAQKEFLDAASGIPADFNAINSEAINEDDLAEALMRMKGANAYFGFNGK